MVAVGAASPSGLVGRWGELHLFAEIEKLLSRVLPEAQIEIHYGDRSRQLRFTPVKQAAAVICSAAAVTYVLAVSLLYGLEMSTDKLEAAETRVLQTAYEDRLATLAAARDEALSEIGELRDRTELAVERLVVESDRLLHANARIHEFETGIDLLETKLHDVVMERNRLRDRTALLRSELQEVSGALDNRFDGCTNTEQTLDSAHDMLELAVAAREAEQMEVLRLESRIYDLRMEARLQQDRNEYVFRNLEGAVEISLKPLERALERSGVDVDRLLQNVRQRYSNAGGPLVPLGTAEELLGESPDLDRFRTLVFSLDHAQVAGLAVQKIPLAMPLRSQFRYTSQFGYRRDPFNGSMRMHEGVDMRAASGTPILSTADGVVAFAGWKGGYGRMVKVRHDFGFETVYGHLRKIRVSVGQRVSRGDRIGDMGNSGRSTGTHLHYEVRENGKSVNPMTYMRAAQDVF